MASDCADWTKPRARSVYFSIFISFAFPRPAVPTRGATSKSGNRFWRPIAPHLCLARDLDAKPHTLSRVTRVAWLRHLHWVSTNRIDIYQSAAVVAVFSGLPRMWASLRKTEEAGPQIRTVARAVGIP